MINWFDSIDLIKILRSWSKIPFVLVRNNGWLIENMNKWLTVPKWVLIKRSKLPQMPQNLSAQIVCSSPKVWVFDEKSHWASVVRGSSDSSHYVPRLYIASNDSLYTCDAIVVNKLKFGTPCSICFLMVSESLSFSNTIPKRKLY